MVSAGATRAAPLTWERARKRAKQWRCRCPLLQELLLLGSDDALQHNSDSPTDSFDRGTSPAAITHPRFWPFVGGPPSMAGHADVETPIATPLPEEKALRSTYPFSAGPATPYHRPAHGFMAQPIETRSAMTSHTRPSFTQSPKASLSHYDSPAHHFGMTGPSPAALSTSQVWSHPERFPFAGLGADDSIQYDTATHR